MAQWCRSPKNNPIATRILPHLAIEARFVAMFQREARLASMLTHTNIVQIIELGEEDGSYFIAMEFVDGAPLQLVSDCFMLGRRTDTEAFV